MSINGLLRVSWDAITSNQIAMNLTGANIANVNTPGYTRQSPEFVSTGSVDVASRRADYGVRVQNIERLYNRYLETQLMDQAEKAGYDDTRQQILGRVEGVFNETSGSGLSDSLDKFWNSWDTLSSNPTSQVAKYSVVSAASNLTSMFQENSDVLSGVQQDIKDSMSVTVADINSQTSEIAKLNVEILATGAENGSANNLLDRRSELLKGLAGNINVSYYENDNGTLSVFLAGGKLLVGGSISSQLHVSLPNGTVTLGSDSTSLNNIITGGRLGAMIEMDGTTTTNPSVVEVYSDKLDRLANSIVTAVNDLHTTAWGTGVGYKASVIDPPIPAEGHENSFDGTVVSGGDFRGIENATYAMKITTGGAFGTAKYQVSTDGGKTWGGENTTPGSGIISMGDGVKLTFTNSGATNLLATGDAYYVNAYPAGYHKDIGPVFFDDTATGARNMRVSDAILADPQNIVPFVSGNNGFIGNPIVPIAAEPRVNLYTGTVSSSGTFTGDVNMAYAMKITTIGGAFGTAKYQVSTDGGDTWGVEKTTTLGSGIVSLGDDGVSLTFVGEPLVKDDIFYVNAYPAADFSTARLISAVKDKLFMESGTSTFNDFYSSLVGQVGSDVNAVDSSITRNTAVTNQLKARRDEASGVSLDEEIMNLMKYQFGYNAAGRLAKTANDMLDVLMALGK